MASDPDPMRPSVRPVPYYPEPTSSEGSGAATASLVLGILGLVCSIIPIIGLISWLLAPAALITGGIGLKSPTSKGLAIGGLVTGGLALIVCLLWLVVFGAAIASVGSARNF
jgi:hypothetical protein